MENNNQITDLETITLLNDISNIVKLGISIAIDYNPNIPLPLRKMVSTGLMFYTIMRVFQNAEIRNSSD